MTGLGDDNASRDSARSAFGGSLCWRTDGVSEALDCQEGKNGGRKEKTNVEKEGKFLV